MPLLGSTSGGSGPCAVGQRRCGISDASAMQLSSYHCQVPSTPAPLRANRLYTQLYMHAACSTHGNPIRCLLAQASRHSTCRPPPYLFCTLPACPCVPQAKRVVQPMPTWEEQSLCIGASFYLTATNSSSGRWVKYEGG